MKKENKTKEQLIHELERAEARIARLEKLKSEAQKTVTREEEHKRAELEMIKVNRVNAVISQINRAIIRTCGRDELLKDISRIVIEYGRFRMAWIGLVDDKEQTVKPVAFNGVEDGYLKKIKRISIRDVPKGRGPTGSAIREKKPYICDDIVNDPRMAPWREEALKRGYRSSIALPIKANNKVIGAFSIYASEPQFFAKEEIGLLEEVTENISFALETLEKEAKRKRAEEELRQLSLRQEALMSEVPDIVMEVDANKIYKWANPAGYEFFGADVIGREAAYYFEGEQDTYVLVQPLFNGEAKTFYLESWQRRKDGERRLLAWWCRVLTGAEGRVSGALSTARDITESRRVEEQIRDLAKFQAENPNPVLRIGRDGVVLYANKSAQSILELWGTKFDEAVPAEWQQRVQIVLETGKSEETELTCGDRVISFFLAPITEGGYVNFYGRDITGHKQAEERMRKSEERYRILAEASHDLITLVNRQLEVEYTNAFAAQQFGVLPQELIGKRLADIFPPEIADRQLSNLQKVFESGESVQIDAPAVFGGNTIWLSSSLIPIKDKDDEAKTILIVSRDITARKRAEEALRTNEQRLSSIYNTVGDVIFYLAIETEGQYRFISVNPSFCRVTGLSPEQIVGKTVTEVIPEPSLIMVLGKYRQAIEAKTIVRWEETFDYPTGRLTGEISVAPVFDDKGRCTHLAGSVHDITERKQAEEQLRKSEEKYRALADHSIQGIMLVEDGRIVYVNSAHCKITGLSVEESLVLTMTQQFELIHPEDRARTIERQTRFQRDEAIRALDEMRVIRKDGEIRWVIVSTKAYSLGGKNYRLGLSIDITERKRAEEAKNKAYEQLRYLRNRLSEVEETERRVLARELHDRVGQNLTALGINFNIIRSQLSKDSLEVIGSRIDDSLEVLEETIAQVRDVMAELRPAVLDDYGLAAAVRWYVDLFTRRTGVSVRMEETGEAVLRLPSSVETNLFRITQEALTNVARHAKAKQVKIQVDVGGKVFRLSIADDGIGFDRSAIAVPGKEKNWGLRIMRERVEAIGGDFQLNSAPGLGTEIIVQIPLSAESSQEIHKGD